MTVTIAELQVKIGAEAEEAKSTLKNLNSSLNSFSKNVTKAASELNGLGAPLKTGAASASAAAASFTRLKTELNGVSTAHAQASVAIRGHATATTTLSRSLTGTGTSATSTGAAVSGMAGKVSGAASALNGHATAAQTLTKNLGTLSGGAQAVGGAIISLGTSAAGAGVRGLQSLAGAAVSTTAVIAKMAAGMAVAFAGAATAGVKFAGDLEESVNSIKSIKPDIDTSAVFKSLNEISTRVPQSAKALGDSLYNIFSSIEINQQDAVALVEKFAKGATGAQTDADTWGTAMLGVMNAYGKGLGDVDAIQDTFFNTINAGVISGKQLASGLGPVTASAKAAGLSIEELGAAMVGVTKEGGDASQNVNNLNNFLQKLTTKPAQEALNQLGVKTVDATGKFLPFADVLTDLKGRLGTMTEAQRANALQAIFPDMQARQGASVLMSQLDAVKSSLAQNRTATDSTNKAYKTMAEGMKAQATLLKNSVVADLTAMGAGMLPAITPGITALAGFFNGQRGTFESFGKFLGTALTNGINTARDAMLTFKSALSGNWADSEKIRPLHALLGNIGLLINRDVIPAWNSFKKTLNENNETIGKVVWALSPLSIALSVIRGFMVGGINGALDAFKLRLEGIGDAAETLADALGFGPQFDAIKNAVGPVITAISGIIDSFGQVVEKSGAMKIAGDIGAKAFELIGEAVSFLDRLIRQNIGPISEFVKGFGNTIKAALDIAIAAFKALEGPIEAVVKFFAPFAGHIGEVAAAFVIYKGAVAGADLASGLLNATSGKLLLSLGKVALVLAPAIAAFELAKATVPGFTTTLDQLGYMAEHTSETLNVLYKKLFTQEVANPFLKMGSAITDADGKLLGYAKSFETYQQAVERINKLNEQGLNMFGNGANLIDSQFAAISKGTSFVYTIAYKTRDLLTGQMSDLAKYQGSFNQYLMFHQNAATVIQSRTIPALDAENAKLAVMQGNSDAAARAINGLATANDELQKKLNTANQVMSVMDTGVAQITTRVGTATAAWGTQNVTLGEAWTKWKDLTAAQLAGGEGAFNAGVQAGQLRDIMIKLGGEGMAPLIDQWFKSKQGADTATKGLVDNTIANEKAKEAAAQASDAVKAQADKVSELGKILNTHGASVSGFGSKVSDVATVTNTANQKLGVWNSLPFTTKTTDTTMIAAAKVLLEGAVAALQAWNILPMASKTATATTTTNWVTNIVNGGGAASAPAPKPGAGNKPSSSSLSGAFGLAGGEFGGGKGLGDLTRTFNDTTQAAAQTGFSLEALKTQINSIVTLFKSIDSKALKVASDQAELVTKITGAASGMTAALTTIDKFGGVAKQKMDSFGVATKQLMDIFVAQAGAFNARALPGVSAYAEGVAKVATGASGMADALGKIPALGNISKDQILMFTNDIQDLMAAFYNNSKLFDSTMQAAMTLYATTTKEVADGANAMLGVLKGLPQYAQVGIDTIIAFTDNIGSLMMGYYINSQAFTKTMLEGMAEYDTTSKIVADSAQAAFNVLSKLTDYSQIGVNTIIAFGADVQSLMMTFYITGLAFNDKMLATAGAYAKSVTDIGSATASAFNGLKVLPGYVQVGVDTIIAFGSDLQSLMNSFTTNGELFTQTMLDKASAFAKATGDATGVIAGAINAFGALKNYSALNRANMALFGSDLVQMMVSFTTAAGLFETESLTASEVFSSAAGKAVAVIGPAISGFMLLGKYKAAARANMAIFVSDVIELVNDFQIAAAEFKTEGLTATEAFSGAVGNIAKGLGDAMTLMSGLTNYKATPSVVIKAFINDVRYAVQLAGQLAQETGTDLTEQINAFGAAMSSIFTGLKDAMEVFKGLSEYKSAPSTVIAAFIEEIKTTIALASNMVTTTSTDLFSQAQEFADATGTIFQKLKEALDLFKSIGEMKDMPRDMVIKLIDGIGEAIKKMYDNLTAANNLYMISDDFAKKMQDAAKRVADGMAAYNSIPTTLPGVPTVPNNGQGGGGGGGGNSSGSPADYQSFAVGGIVPGNWGQAQLAVVHGGERFIGLGGQRYDLAGGSSGGGNGGQTNAYFGDIVIPPGTNVNDPEALKRTIAEVVLDLMAGKGKEALDRTGYSNSGTRTFFG